MIYNIIQELNLENGSNYKIATLQKYTDNELLKRVLKMTYDKCVFTYGITMKNVDDPIDRKSTYVRTLDEVLDYLENNYVTRNVTGHNALDIMSDLLFCLTLEDRQVLRLILGRDLKINMGRTNINKVFKGLITKPLYQRCGTFNEKTKKKFNPVDAFVQLKADGTYREFKVIDNEVECISRSGEEYSYVDIHNELSQKSDGVYHGELTVYDENNILLNRAIGNGMLRKDVFPEGHTIVLDCWDYITLEEYNAVADGNKGITPYYKRFETLTNILDNNSNVRVIESYQVKTIQEALQHTAEWMKDGKEGAIIKEKNAVFKNGTSAQQLKLKLEINIDVRITGFKEGTPGTVREKTFGSMFYTTDDGKITGAVSGFKNHELEDFNSRRTEMIGQIMELCANDITIAQNSETWALSHPRFVEIRDDKDTTDTFERAMDVKNMAMMVNTGI